MEFSVYFTLDFTSLRRICAYSKTFSGQLRFAENVSPHLFPVVLVLRKRNRPAAFRPTRSSDFIRWRSLLLGWCSVLIIADSR